MVPFVQLFFQNQSTVIQDLFVAAIVSVFLRLGPSLPDDKVHRPLGHNGAQRLTGRVGGTEIQRRKEIGCRTLWLLKGPGFESTSCGVSLPSSIVPSELRAEGVFV